MRNILAYALCIKSEKSRPKQDGKWRHFYQYLVILIIAVTIMAIIIMVIIIMVILIMVIAIMAILIMARRD